MPPDLGMPHWLDTDERFISSQMQLLELFDLLLNRGYDSHQFLKGSGLFYEDVLNPDHAITPSQFHRLLSNIERLHNSGDIAFLFGERQFYNHLHPVSTLLSNAQNLRSALEQLCEFSMLLFPLYHPHCYEDDTHYYLYWTSSFQAETHHHFLAASCAGFISSLCQRITAEKPNWQLHFKHASPGNLLHYEERFGQRCTFDSLANVMCFNKAQLDQPNPQFNATAALVSRTRCEAELARLEGRPAFLNSLYNYLVREACHQPNLESTATHFGISPATLKRKLKLHGSSYQHLSDIARSHLTLYWLYCKGYSNDVIAERLNFHDARNFRRSFKRWTGTLPSALRQQMA